MKKLFCSVAIVPILGLSIAAPVLSQDDALPIIEKAFEAAKVNEAKAREYVYYERVEERHFNRKGKERKRESKTYDVTLFDDSEHRRLIARNDRPLDARAEAKEQKKLDKQIRKMQRETPRQREQRRARIEKEQAESEEFLEEITRAFDFRLIGQEEIDGIGTYVVSAVPREGYEPPNRRARVLTRVRAKLWISRADYGWVQAEIETFGDITWAAIYKLREGALVRFKQRLLDDEVWITEWFNVRLRAKIALVYRVDAEFGATYSNFRRFTTDTSVTGWTPANDG